MQCSHTEWYLVAYKLQMPLFLYTYTATLSIHSMLLAKGTVTTPTDASWFLKEVLASENV